MRFRNPFLVVALLIAVTATAWGAVSNSLEEWGKGAAQYVMTKEEFKEWKSIRSDADAQAFIDLFWARRDPTPATPQNEFRDQFELLVQRADQEFKEGRTRGSMTDRGKMFVLFGAPTRRSRRTETAATPSGPDPSGGSQIAEQASAVTEVWSYEQERVPPFLGANRLELTFRDDFGAGRYRVVRSSVNINEAIEKAIQNNLKSPALTEAPKYQVEQPKQVVEVTVPAASITAPATFKTASLQAAFTDFRAAKTSPYKDVYVTYGEFVTPEGEYFIPVQLYLTENPGTTVEQPVTFFGVVEDREGNIVAVYEEPLKLQASKKDFLAEKSIRLSPGKYTGTFGIATEGKPLAMAKTEMDLAGLDKDATGISQLLLSNNVFPLTIAQQPTDPFAFGGLKVVPKSNRLFDRSDDLAYFVELRNPGLDEAGAPKVQVGVDVEGTVSGNPVRLASPLREANVFQMKGVPGHFGVIDGFPLAGFSPGNYTIKVKLIDTIKKQTYNLEEKFKIVG